MGGLKSRRKGRTREYEVRDYFRKLGYEADRVPMSGAASGFKGDIRVRAEGKEFTVEVKSRKDAFDNIYEFLRRPHTPSAFVWNGVGIAWSNDFVTLLRLDYFFDFRETHSKKDIKVLNKIVKLKEFLQTCDYLVIKADRQPLLFFKFL